MLICAYMIAPQAARAVPASTKQRGNMIANAACFYHIWVTTLPRSNDCYVNMALPIHFDLNWI